MNPSNILGWIYFISWSISFYPQILLNVIRNSTNGLSLDFVVLNCIGFACYSMYTNSLYFSKALQSEYESRFGSSIGIPVQDVVFANHALFISAFTFLQCVYYSPERRISHWLIQFMGFLAFGASLVSIESIFKFVSALDIIYYFSGVKMIITLIKYVPQVYLNYKSKSTIGWSIGNVLLDLLGGSTSISQQIVDAIHHHDSSIILGNPVKLFLGLASITFDFIFLYQHYILYPMDSVEYEEIVNTEDPLFEENNANLLDKMII